METAPIKAARDSAFVHSFFFFFWQEEKEDGTRSKAAEVSANRSTMFEQQIARKKFVAWYNKMSQRNVSFDNDDDAEALFARRVAFASIVVAKTNFVLIIVKFKCVNIKLRFQHWLWPRQ